jgi:methyl-accepting chemotaxis protein
MPRNIRKASGSATVLEAELDLMSTVEGMKGALDCLGTNVFIADRDLRLIYMNRRAQETLNKASSAIKAMFNLEADELVGLQIDAFHGNKSKHIRQALSDVRNLPIRKEIRLGEFVLDLNVNAVLDEQGRYIGTVVNWEEIAERKRLEKTNVEYIRQIEALSRTQAIAEYEMDGTILSANNNFLNAMGYSLDEIKGRHHAIFVDELERQHPAYKEFWEKLNRGEFQGGAVRLYGKGGHEIWMEGSYNLLLGTDGKPTKVVQYAVDITAQKQAATKRQTFMELQLDGTIITANDNFLEMIGYRLDEVKGKHHRMLCPESFARSNEYKEFWAKLNRGEVVTGNYAHIDKDGHEIWVKASCNCLVDKLGKPFRVVEYATDITARRQMENDIAQNAGSVSSSAEELTAISQQMAGNAEETATQANVVSAASEQVSNNVAVVATGAEQMQASIREISKHANEAAHVAKSAVAVAESTNKTISKLGESSTEIGKVIKVITSIAQQTNLLALNATIEAARAGEAGKGFAVVANEVKELAKQTARATEEIGQKIEAIQTDTKSAVMAIAEISGIINEINNISNNIASAVEEQSVTTNEIAHNVAEAAKGTGDIAKNISGVAAAARETTQAASDTQKAAQALSELAAQLQSLVNDSKSIR